MSERLAQGVRIALLGAFGWVAWNIALVYLAWGGARAFRIESAMFLLLPIYAAHGFLAAPGAARALPARTGPLVTIAVLAVALWATVMLPLVGFPFLSDDYVFLAHAVSPDGVLRWEFYRPLFFWVFTQLTVLGGGSPWPFHLTAFLLHLVSSALVYRLSVRVIGQGLPALVAAMLFLLNPLQLEAVLWVSGLQEILWAFFALLALEIYLPATGLTPARVALASIAAACAIASKETAVSLVLLLPAADLWLRRRQFRLQFAAYGAVATILALYVVLRQASVSGEVPVELFAFPGRYLIKEFLVTPYRMFVHPWNRTAVDVPMTVMLVTSLVALGALLALARSAGGRRAVWAGAFVIAATTAPVFRYMFGSPELEHARHFYLPSAGWGMLAGAAVGTIPSRAGAVALAAALALGATYSLSLNLRPWHRSATLVRELAEAVRAGADLAPVVEEWTRSTGSVVAGPGVLPPSHQGVWLFLNGGDEFVRLTRIGAIQGP